MRKFQVKRFVISQLLILLLGIVWETYFILKNPEGRLVLLGVMGLVVSFLGTFLFNLFYFIKTELLFLTYVFPGIASFFAVFILFAENKDLSFFYFLSFAIFNLLLGAVWLMKPIVKVSHED